MALAPHDILAGPIVRRVEPDLVSVWIALRKPASVRLRVYRGLGNPGQLSEPIAAVPIPDRSSDRGVPPDNHTLAVGAELHVAVAMMQPVPPTRLDWGQIFSYDLRLQADDGGPEVGFTELGMLADGDVTGPDGLKHPQLALGYTPGALPSFAMPATLPMQLRLIHGSCRFPTGEGKDTMPEIDGVIGANLGDPVQRPQMLILTGDQIYADDTGPEYGHICSKVAAGLIAGHKEGDPAAELPTTERLNVLLDVTAGLGFPFPVDRLHFPVGRRTHLLSTGDDRFDPFLGGPSPILPRFSSQHLSAQVLGLGEFSATYLTMWSNLFWPDLKPLLQARWSAVDAYRKKSKTLHDIVEALRQSRAIPRQIDERLKYYFAWLLVPPEDRALDAYLSDLDVAGAWAEEGDAPAVWAPFWSGVGHPEFAPAPRSDAPPATGTADERKNRGLLARVLTPSWFAGVRHYKAMIDFDDDPEGTVRKDDVRERLHLMSWFAEGLPRVRRALANVATFMIFDDHEVTDDWNINLRWARGMRDNPLGRGVVRNALAAYALFQGWGNDPRAFARADSVPNQVLRNIHLLFYDESGQLRREGPDRDAAEKLERSFDLLSTISDPVPVEERMRWDYRYEGSGFEMLVLDTRTWRSFERDADPSINEPLTDEANAALLTAEAMQMQIPADPPPGVVPSLPDPATGAVVGGFTIVVSAAPVLGYPPVESIFQPILNIKDLIKLPPSGTFATLRKPYEFLGRANYDPEPWAFVPRTFEALLARLRNRRRVIFLSGDVHYSCMLATSYWSLRAGTVEPARFIQLTSSAFRNQQPIKRVEYFSMDLAQQIGAALGNTVERLGWFAGATGTPEAERPVEPPPPPPPPPPPDQPPPDPDFNQRVKYLMTIDPILLPPQALPPGTRQIRPPDWAWRQRLLGDIRPDDVRLALLLPPPLRPPSDGPATMVHSAADRHIWQAEHAPDRRWLWWSNFGLVDFVETEGKPAVRHSLYCFDLKGLVGTAQPYVVAIAPLDVAPDERPPDVPTGAP